MVEFANLQIKFCGSSSVGRATAFQAVGRGFEPRLPLCTVGSIQFAVRTTNCQLQIANWKLPTEYAVVAQG